MRYALTVPALLFLLAASQPATAAEPRHADVVADAILALGPAAPAEERARLAAELAEAKKRVATVLLKPAPGGAPLDEGAVLVDGKHAADLPLRRPLYLEPGERKIAIVVEGRRFVPVAADLAAGQNVAVTLREVDPRTPAPPPPDDKPLWPGILLASVGAVGVGLGVGLLVVSFNEESDADALGNSIGTCDPARLDAACDELASIVADRNAFRNGSYVSFVIGGIAGAASLAYFLVPTPRETPESAASARVHLTPVLGPSTWGLSLGGAF